MAPAGTPGPAVGRLNAAVREAVGQSAVQVRMAQAGLDAAASGPTELAGFIREETARWGLVVRERRIRVE